MIDAVSSPTGTHRNEKRGQRYLFLTGRLKPGVTVEGANANLTALMTTLEQENPATNKNRRPTVISANSVRVMPGVDSAIGRGPMCDLGDHSCHRLWRWWMSWPSGP